MVSTNTHAFPLLRSSPCAVYIATIFVLLHTSPPSTMVAAAPISTAQLQLRNPKKSEKWEGGGGDGGGKGEGDADSSVGAWLSTLLLDEYASLFKTERFETLEDVRDITEQDLLEMGVPRGYMRRILAHLPSLAPALAQAPTRTSAPASVSINHNADARLASESDGPELRSAVAGSGSTNTLHRVQAINIAKPLEPEAYAQLLLPPPSASSSSSSSNNNTYKNGSSSSINENTYKNNGSEIKAMDLEASLAPSLVAPSSSAPSSSACTVIARSTILSTACERGGDGGGGGGSSMHGVYPLLVTATPRSGTVYTQQMLRRLGLDVSNDWGGKESLLV